MLEFFLYFPFIDTVSMPINSQQSDDFNAPGMTRLRILTVIKNSFALSSLANAQFYLAPSELN